MGEGPAVIPWRLPQGATLAVVRAGYAKRPAGRDKPVPYASARRAGAVGATLVVARAAPTNSVTAAGATSESLHGIHGSTRAPDVPAAVFRNEPVDLEFHQSFEGGFKADAGHCDDLV